jgi:hypothetical protein
VKSLNPAPRVVLLCHHDEPFDREGLASWLATTMRLVGLVVVREPGGAWWRSLARERRRAGWTAAADALAFRVCHWLVDAPRDAWWTRRAVAQLRATCPVVPSHVPRLDVADPNDEVVRTFLGRLEPDIVLTRCRAGLSSAIVAVARAGTFAIHPGLCPDYRDTDGCFWALVRRDLSRIGVTLLRLDPEPTRGAVFLRADAAFDETIDSHVVIARNAVLENLGAIRRALVEIGEARRVPIASDEPAPDALGLPRLSARVRWKLAAWRESRRSAAPTRASSHVA